jgi:hypothetical protein
MMARVVDLQTPPADVYHTAGGYSHQMAPPSSKPPVTTTHQSTLWTMSPLCAPFPTEYSFRVRRGIGNHSMVPSVGDPKRICCYSCGEKCVILVQIGRTRRLVAISFMLSTPITSTSTSLDSLTYMKMDLARLLHMSSPVETMESWPAF